MVAVLGLALTYTGVASTSGDGATTAPAGPPQFPSLLDKYPTRPPWKVAGVHYHVGIDRTKYPSNSNLKVPSAANMPPGCKLSGSTVYVDGSGGITNGIVLDGFNFGSNFTLQVTAGNSPRISNCFFARNAYGCQFVNNQQTATTAVGGIVENNEFDQAQNPAWIAPILIISNASDQANPHVIRYNLFSNSQSEHFQIHDGFSNGHIAQVYYYVKYNVFHNAGCGAPVGAHGDWTHIWGGNLSYCENAYNLYWQDLPGSQAATRGVIDVSEQSKAASLTIANNTMITAAGTNVQQFAAIIGAMIQSLAKVYDNYLDRSGGMAYTWQLDPYTTNCPYPANAGKADLKGNISMLNGAAMNS